MPINEAVSSTSQKHWKFENTDLAVLRLVIKLQYVKQFQQLSKEILGLPNIEHFDMIHLDCEDLKQDLSKAASALAQMILDRLAASQRQESLR